MTPALVDKVRADYAQLGCSIAALDAAPPPPPPPVVVTNELFTRYNSAYCGNVTRYACGIDASGNACGPPMFSSTVDRSTTTFGRISWGWASEHHQIVTAPNGAQWSCFMASEDTASGNVYKYETVRADWGPLNGPYEDISRVTPVGANGAPYCPLLLPPSGTWRLRVWMFVHNVLGVRDRPCYSEQVLTFGGVVNNPAWKGEGLQKRPAISYQEAWYDTAAGWVRGTAPSLPWTQSGATWYPADVATTFFGTDAFGMGHGVLWQYQYPDYRVALTR